MSNQTEPKLWEKKTFASAAFSALLAALAAVSVCAVRGETLALPPMTHVSGSQSHLDSSEGK